ncbi:MAG: AIR carboxylase family protein [Kofleriaceae bacterium]
MCAAVPGAVYLADARVVQLRRRRGRRAELIAVVAAGTSDLPVLAEAAATAEFLGAGVVRVIDVGVAGPHRLEARLDELRAVTMLIVIAGMEAALPSVIAGKLDKPIIRVPTSVSAASASAAWWPWRRCCRAARQG